MYPFLLTRKENTSKPAQSDHRRVTDSSHTCACTNDGALSIKAASELLCQTSHRSVSGAKCFSVELWKDPGGRWARGESERQRERAAARNSIS